MNYKTITAYDYNAWYQVFRKNIHEAWLNVTRDGITVSPSISSKYKLIPEGAELVKFHHSGGTIVGFPGNVALFAFTRPTTAPTWMRDLAAFLVSKGLNAVVDKNDVLVDGYKVAGAFSRKFGDTYVYYGIHISINCDAELIAQIVDKPMLKTPKGLSDYGITREEVLAALGVETGGEVSE